MSADLWIPPEYVNEFSVDLGDRLRDYSIVVDARFDLSGQPYMAQLSLDFRQSNPSEETVIAAFKALRAQGCERLSVRVQVYDDDTYGGTYAEGERPLSDHEMRKATEIAERKRARARAAAEDKLARIKADFPELVTP